MTIKTTVILVLVGVGVLASAGVYGWYRVRQAEQANGKLNDQLQQAQLDIGKAHTELGNAQSQAKKDSDADLDVIKARDETITQYAKLIAAYKAQGGGSDVAPTPSGTPVDNTEPLIPGQLYIAQSPSLLQLYSLPMSLNYSDFRLDAITTLGVKQSGSAYSLTADTKYNLHLKIMAQLVTTIGETGAVNNYANVFEVDDKGNKLGKFELTSFEAVVQDQRKAKFTWFNPRLDLGLMGTAFGLHNYAWGGSLGVSLASYGLSNNDCSWRFLRLGLDLYEKNVGFEVEPFMWNFARYLPLISNLWLGPGVTYGLGSGQGFGLGGILSVSL
jgi:hypothetical protein